MSIRVVTADEAVGNALDELEIGCSQDYGTAVAAMYKFMRVDLPRDVPRDERSFRVAAQRRPVIGRLYEMERGESLANSADMAPA